MRHVFRNHKNKPRRRKNGWRGYCIFNSLCYLSCPVALKKCLIDSLCGSTYILSLLIIGWNMSCTCTLCSHVHTAIRGNIIKALSGDCSPLIYAQNITAEASLKIVHTLWWCKVLTISGGSLLFGGGWGGPFFIIETFVLTCVKQPSACWNGESANQNFACIIVGWPWSQFQPLWQQQDGMVSDFCFLYFSMLHLKMCHS